MRLEVDVGEGGWEVRARWCAGFRAFMSGGPCDDNVVGGDPGRNKRMNLPGTAGVGLVSPRMAFARMGSSRVREELPGLTVRSGGWSSMTVAVVGLVNCLEFRLPS